MTKTEAAEMFREQRLSAVVKYEEDGVIDWPARREAWNDFIDYLLEEGDITFIQAETWDYPRGLERVVEPSILE